jgi:RNA recognition motif-containing protein
MKIIILNLNRETPVEQLAALFKKHGTVESCNLVMDKEKGKSKGFGFVEMSVDAEANAAITALHGMRLDNQKIRVKVSNNVPNVSSDINP